MKKCIFLFLEEKIQEYDLYCSQPGSSLAFSKTLFPKSSVEASGGPREKPSGLQISGREMVFHPSGSEEPLEHTDLSASRSSSDMESGNESECPKDCVVSNTGFPPSPPSTAASRRRDPLDILTKVFPSHKQNRLERILQFCKGDIVQAIEQILNVNEHKQGLQDLASSSLPEHDSFHRSSDFSLLGVDVRSLGNKSAFSPLQTHASSLGSDLNLYSFNSRLEIRPLRVAYSPQGRALHGFVSPYLRSGWFSALPFHPAMDYSFLERLKDSSYFPNKDSVATSSVYSRQAREENK